MNILIVKLSAIGDVIHALPVSYAIKETFPKARVTWAVEPPARELLVDNPYIDEILLFEKKKFKSFGGFRKHFGSHRHDTHDIERLHRSEIETALPVPLAEIQTRSSRAPSGEGAGIFSTV